MTRTQVSTSRPRVSSRSTASEKPPRNGGDGERSREALLRAAAELFATQGYAATTVRDIAHAAKVNISLVSYHFKGKEGLYREVIEPYGKDMLESSRRILQPAKNADEFRVRLRVFLEELMARQLNRPELCRIVHRDVDMEIEATEGVFRRTLLPIFELVMSYFKQAQKAELVSKSADSEAIARFVFGSMANLLRFDSMHERLYGRSLHDPKYRQSILDNLCSLICDGVLGARPQSRKSESL